VSRRCERPEWTWESQPERSPLADRVGVDGVTTVITV
jgi:hypothetical protein